MNRQLPSLARITLTVVFVLSFILIAPCKHVLAEEHSEPTTEIREGAIDAEIRELSRHLNQLVQFNSPTGRGREDFIIEEPKDESLTKIELGKYLFHETALSINPKNSRYWQTVSCATCHLSDAGFRSNLRLGIGAGGLDLGKKRYPDPEISPIEVDRQRLLTPSILNLRYQEALTWDGRFESRPFKAAKGFPYKLNVFQYNLPFMESEAMDAFSIHGFGTAAIANIAQYQNMFAAAFPDRPYISNQIEDLRRSAQAITAYERTVVANEAPFQKWLKGDELALSKSELRGATVFFKSTCIKCHTGPSLSDSRYHALGFPEHPAELGAVNLSRGDITGRLEDDFKFKTPQLYNLKDSHPYGHGGSFKTIHEVVEYLNEGNALNLPAKYSGNLSPWFGQLNLSPDQISDLVNFLENGLRDPSLERYIPISLPSGLCFPNNDPESKKKLKC